jgi:hypothetical protein
MSSDYSEVAMAVLFIAFALAILTIVFAAVFSRIYRAIRAEGESYGIVIGELREMRRRDEMNVRARQRANEMLIAEMPGGNEFTEEELDV